MKYNPTCQITGKKDNLRMHALRNETGDMVGWLFIHESVVMEHYDFNVTSNDLREVKPPGYVENPSQTEWIGKRKISLDHL